ncbi:hypothetical protein VB711_12110 [Cronbergia sp. UHCC 0137]|nr:hypothetical protein [Cronbergia sp. UHCC 0137]MEA5618574.1 hypothetical protein [Cronbergia sp. UHCC 0137]
MSCNYSVINIVGLTQGNPTLYLRGMLEEVVDRPNLGQKRPFCSKDHHNNLHDITACVRKMLVILNAMIRDHLPWSMTHDSQPISA